ncbi:uncharacterized protein C8A04DRAFT_15479 [Dichotomopilus funicola]|uniref:Nuclear pore complex protein Nup85 n=1 Tax=Dichotomopilus funicola TaxID=1934379 RepID=A0AAN6UVT3_9PEZI|nr:hypothetical protein C8A04DRAFT_15479 [Dichotomopilus funicola]
MSKPFNFHIPSSSIFNPDPESDNAPNPTTSNTLGNSIFFAPSTPDRFGTNTTNNRQSTASQHNAAPYTGATNRSTTPSGPAPSEPDYRGSRASNNSDLNDVSTASFTPAGAPSERYLGGSILKGMDTNTGRERGEQPPKGLFASGGPTKGLGQPAQGLFTSGQPAKGLFTTNQSNAPSGPSPAAPGLFTGIGGGFDSASGFTSNAGNTAKKTLFSNLGGDGGAGPKNTPLGRSIRGTAHTRQPSRLSKSVMVAEEEEEESPKRAGPSSVTAQKATTATSAGGRGRTFGVPLDEEDEGDSEYLDDADADGEGDMWLDMPEEGGRSGPGDESDLMMLATPAATERVRREAEDLFRASSFHTGTGAGVGAAAGSAAGAARRRELRYAALAKDVYQRMGTAELTEPPEVILDTDKLLAKLYDEGVGAGDVAGEDNDDDGKLDDALATVASKLVGLWKDYVDTLPAPTGQDHAVEIGPGPYATAFEQAHYLANLALQVHHTRYYAENNYDGDKNLGRAEPLPETLFRWLGENHDMYGHQVDEILRHRPSPACHSLFWQAVFLSLLRGRVVDAVRLLDNAGWGHVRRGSSSRVPGGTGSEYAYTGRALENVERAVHETIAVLETCPGIDGQWEIWASDWNLFRVRARASLEHLRRFAEGKDAAFGEPGFSSPGDTRGGNANRLKQSMAGLARRAESQVPWDIYENLNVVFDIVLGQESAILEAAQDWLEATVGLFGWWDERAAGGAPTTTDRPFNMSQSLSRSQALVLPGGAAGQGDTESYLDRLARTFHMAVASDFHFNSQSPVEVGMACVFEDNAKGVIGLLRGWSLPIAAAVAEIASLGKWLPPHQFLLSAGGGAGGAGWGMGDLDMDDLEVLGMDPGAPAPDEVDGIKDSTLVQYAQALADYQGLNSQEAETEEKDGWELAINVLGRMDASERSEEVIRELVEGLVSELHVDSRATVDRLWWLLNELGMIEYAEDTTETYGNILARDSHRYGEAMWYYALAHRPNKVREVMNLLIAYSLLQSTAFPPAADLDDHLRRLLADRQQTLQQAAAQDVEAAELLGKMLSGYAALRQFYDLRDNTGLTDTETGSVVLTETARRQQAAAALVSVIAASDDNIRGGLFDQTRDGIVSEDFLLALLGEALVFVSNPDDTSVHHLGGHHPTAGGTARSGAALSLEQIDTLLKAIEDLQAVAPRVYTACDDFLKLVLASAPGGLKGSTPGDLLKSTTSTTPNSHGKGKGGGGNMMAGNSLVASQLQKSLSGGKVLALGKVPVPRGWDWRGGLVAGTEGGTVLGRLRLGLARDLAGLWVEGW